MNRRFRKVRSIDSALLEENYDIYNLPESASSYSVVLKKKQEKWRSVDRLGQYWVDIFYCKNKKTVKENMNCNYNLFYRFFWTTKFQYLFIRFFSIFFISNSYKKSSIIHSIHKMFIPFNFYYSIFSGFSPESVTVFIQ